MASDTLNIPIKKEHWEKIRDGTKPLEYRLYKEHWIKRIENKDYKYVSFNWAYPKQEEKDKRVLREYLGYEIQEIVHPEFGDKKVKVFAIHTNGKGVVR